MTRWLQNIAMSLGLLLGALGVSASAQDAAEMLLRLDRLESENRRLTGQVEEMSFQIRRLDEQLKRQQADNDLRFRDLEQGRGAAPRANAPASPGPNVAQPPGGRRQDAFDPVTSPAAPGGPRPLTPGLPGSGDISAPLDVTRNPRAAVAPLPQTGPSGDPRVDYEAARTLLEQGSHAEAEGAFREFLRAHPRDRRVADATFFLGESFLMRTRYREAAEQYLTVTTNHSKTGRAPEAMLKLGIALRGLGAKSEACGTFNQLPVKYPNASAAIRAAVEREKVRAQC
ncbi:MAG: tol-pal system protein YbgF [Methylobacterium sp.]|nr:MAG: tol-pal system protein YbgF [Methylobacterium sp.]